MIIEARVLQYLSGKLSIPVYAEMPEKPEDELVLIERVGGSVTNWISRASIALQSYAKDILRAMEIDKQVRAAMDKLYEIDGISSARMASNYNHTDTRTKYYRYQCTYDITYEEEYNGNL